MNARLAVIGRLPPMPAPAGTATGALANPRGTRRIMLEGGVAEVPVYDFAALGADQPVAGPAIVESDTTTVLLLPGDAARMDARGWLEITLPEQS